MAEVHGSTSEEGSVKLDVEGGNDRPAIPAVEAVRNAAGFSEAITSGKLASGENHAGPKQSPLADASFKNMMRVSSLPPESQSFKNSNPFGIRSGTNLVRSVTEKHPDQERIRVTARPFKDLEQRANDMAKALKSIIKSSKIQDDYTVKIENMELPKEYKEEILMMDERPEELDTSVISGDSVVPPLNICMLIVGTRGDVQPFMAIGKRLQEHGHRVRLATHANFREFVTSEGLEFYPLGGDPKVLAEYMVKNKGFLPSGPAEVLVQRKQLKAIIESTYPACTEADEESKGQPFIADAIMANPPSLGHIHVAEALEIPLHIFFTMPWSPTKEWPHPLARVVQVTGFENRLSYAVVDNIIWLGARDLVNQFRKKKLKLRPITYLGDVMGSQKKVIPHGYIWSPSLAPKPQDWGPAIDVVGFCFLSLAPNYTPPQDLVAWLKAGPPPIFVGFGSLPVQDPKGMTTIIVKAMEQTQQRFIIQKGWGGLGEMENPPESMYLLGNCPHDWLFPQCKAVIHHGGAGTTAAGLKAACPTTIVPFFGDQPFWGSRVHAEGVGPDYINVGNFSLERLVKAINFMLQAEVKQAAEVLAGKINQEDGVEGAVKAFHKHLPRGIKHGDHATPWLRKKERLKFRFLGCMGSPAVQA